MASHENSAPKTFLPSSALLYAMSADLTCVAMSSGKFLARATPSFGIGPAVSMTFVFVLMSGVVATRLSRASMNVAAPSTVPWYTASAALGWLPANLVLEKNVFGSWPVLFFMTSVG